MTTKHKEAPSGAELVNPYDSDNEKSAQIEKMFDSISPVYDFMNTAMTFGMHRIWRNSALKAAKNALGKIDGNADILDIATGTGDLAFRMLCLFPNAAITGVDLSSGMLSIARKKAESLPEADKLRISFEEGDCLNLRFADNSFSLVTVAYGVRNFERLLEGYSEIRRVLRPGGVLCVIELSQPRHFPLRQGYNVYSRSLIPFVGRLVSGDAKAYTYLPESIAACPQRDDMTALMKRAGFRECRWRSLFPDAVTYYLAKK